MLSSLSIERYNAWEFGRECTFQVLSTHQASRTLEGSPMVNPRCRLPETGSHCVSCWWSSVLPWWWKLCLELRVSFWGQRTYKRCTTFEASIRHHTREIHARQGCFFALNVEIIDCFTRLFLYNFPGVGRRWIPFLGIVQFSKISTYPWPSKVRKAVNQKIAQVAAWSMSFAASGIGPPVGFSGEEFDKGTYRYHLRGKELALGWRPFALQRRNVFGGFRGWTNDFWTPPICLKHM